MSLRVLIADDEPVARRRIRRLLKMHPDAVVVGEAGDGQAAVDAVGQLAPDLLFLDVQMPVKDGFDVVAGLGDRLPAVIFVTAFDEYALRAFDVHALDYLLKPFTRQRFDAAFERARDHLARRGGGLDARVLALLQNLPARPHLTCIPVRTSGRIRIIQTADVDWIRSADNYITIAAGGREYLLRETMEGIERELDPQRFVRVHRSAIVQVDRIVELQPSFHGDFSIVLKDGSRLTLSRSYRDRVARVLGRPL
jgi:two-component system, LytTR family, response regulator